MSTFIIDIESLALPLETLQAMMPAFDEKEVALGNLKDPVKIAEKIESARARHSQRFIEDAALNAHTGSVKLIGVEEVGGVTSLYFHEADFGIVQTLRKWASKNNIGAHAFMDEKQMLEAFSKDFALMLGSGEVIGYFSNTFDFPFIARRGAILGVNGIMRTLRRHRRGRYLDESKFIDLDLEWKLGDRETHCGGLDGLAQKLGIAEAKLGDGQSFGEWWSKDPTEACQYCLNDILLTRRCAERLGVI